MYSNDTCRVKVVGFLSDEIRPNQGVRQGCVLSPLLFNLFLADLPDLFNDDINTPKIDEMNKISCLLWADDLILFSETESGLNNMINKLSDYNELNSISLNVDKTKCMTFNKTGRLIKRVFKYRDKLIESVREYKYLGFIITPSGEISTGLCDLKDRASRALSHLRARMGDSFKKHVDTSMKLFDALIKPILIYMSDFWGCLKLPKNNPIEIFQNKFLKLLGVQRQTTNIGVLLETGRIPMHIYAKRNCVKNSIRISKDQWNTLLQRSYQYSLETNSIWTKSVEHELASVGLYDLFLNNGSNVMSVENTLYI